MRPKIVFLGTPQFAMPSLERLCGAYDVAAVVCQPDRARDRKGCPVFSPVKTFALDHGIPVLQFEKIRVSGIEPLSEIKPEIMVTCAYGQILSQEVLDIPGHGVLNVHASLLPSYRGSAPIQWSLINGEERTGVSIMKTDIGLDTGDVLAAAEFQIEDWMYHDDLSKSLSVLGADLLACTIDGYLAGKIMPIPQNHEFATKCRMLKKEDAIVDWSLPAAAIRNKIRGIGYGITAHDGEILKLFKLDIFEGELQGDVGSIRVDRDKLLVKCGSGAVEITQLQPQNKSKMSARDFLNGYKSKISFGDILKI